LREKKGSSKIGGYANSSVAGDTLIVWENFKGPFGSFYLEELKST
jgi:hypothetical protein